MENRLQEILDKRGLKKGWLAERAEVHRNTITALIRGVTPGLDLAYKIADILNVSVYDIWPR